MASVSVPLTLSEEEASDLAQLVKRIVRSDLGPRGLNLVTKEEEAGAESALLILRDALVASGFSPR